MTKCKCGQPTRIEKLTVVVEITHAGRSGVIWLRNNEVKIRRAAWSSRKAPHNRHLGTFQTYQEAEAKLITALQRVRH